ncbi:2766_t:CDS:1, partial [Dentiscutata erythropus]
LSTRVTRVSQSLYQLQATLAGLNFWNNTASKLQPTIKNTSLF